MHTVESASKYVRSKNAGPFWTTIDIFCGSVENLERFKNSERFNEEEIAGVYRTRPEIVKIFFLDNLKVVKISIPKEEPSGHRHERDMHSGQQYIQLLDLEI